MRQRFLWIPTTPEVEVKLALARQDGDEAKHYRLIEEHLRTSGVDLNGFDPVAGALTWFALKVLMAIVCIVWAFRLVETPGRPFPE